MKLTLSDFDKTTETGGEDKLIDDLGRLSEAYRETYLLHWPDPIYVMLFKP